MARGNILTIENTKLILRNFSGKADKYTPEGKRSFGVLVSPEDAEALENAGVAVKYLKPRHEEDDPVPWVKVHVNMERENPPKVFTDRNGDKQSLDGKTIKNLDYADIENASMQVAVRDWDFAGKTGKSLYLEKLICFLSEDDFMSKYNLDDVYD